ncbi:glycosyltransferase [Bacillus piscicola]|uniref:glycosyltransferase n=1 Tax=Bacillus piscicola TaxID=1632684 RepID=UPI001F097DAA|nr:glycosyltransferase [Bacillus piscicola]
MKVLHIASLDMNMSAGLTYSVPSYVNAQNNLDGITSHLMISTKNEKSNKQFFYRKDFKNNDLFLRFLKGYDIVNFHSNYIVEHVKIAKLLKANNIPYVIIPRGGFTKGSKEIKKLKKKIADLLIFNRFFNTPSAIQFLTSMEKEESVHRTDYDFILPNGIDIPKSSKQNYDGGDIRLIFIGRLDIYHKGLDILVAAISKIKHALIDKNVSVDFYGPFVRDSEQQLNELIKSHEIENIIKVHPPIFLEEKLKVLYDSHIFIQTSRFEGMPMGILEALSVGLPCILTPGTNLSKEVKSYSAGIEVLPTVESVSEGILKMIDLINNDKSINENAVSLANSYSWEKIAQESVEVYSKIIINKLKN